MTEELIGLFDTHAHPTDERFNEDREQVLARMREAGMLCMCVGADMASSAQSVALANENENIYAAVGVHPHDAKDFTEADIPQLTRWLTQEKKVKALGEIGLDYYYDLSPREIQKTVFERQLDLAYELKSRSSCISATRTATPSKFCARTGTGCRIASSIAARPVGRARRSTCRLIV